MLPLQRFHRAIHPPVHPFHSSPSHTPGYTSRLSSRVPHAPLLPPLLSRRFFLFSPLPVASRDLRRTAIFVADYSSQQFLTRARCFSIICQPINEPDNFSDNCEIFKKFAFQRLRLDLRTKQRKYIDHLNRGKLYSNCIFNERENEKHFILKRKDTVWIFNNKRIDIKFLRSL